MSALAGIGAVLVGAAAALAAVPLARALLTRRAALGTGAVFDGPDPRPAGPGEPGQWFGDLARAADGVISRRGWEARARAHLRRARLERSPGEAAVIVAAAAATAGLLAGAAVAPVAGLMLSGVTVAAAPMFVRARARRAVARFESDLPDALDLLAGSLEAGTSLAQAMELVAAEGRPPLAPELARVLADTRLGEPLHAALAASVERVGSRDWAWCVRAIRVQQEVGASLANLLRTLAQFMRWRWELRREVSALTAEGRISAAVLIGLPFAVSGFFLLANPSYLSLLVTTPVGWAMTIAAAGLMVLGTVWMRRIVKVEM